MRGILLKGNDAGLLLPELWPILAFVVAGVVALKRYRQTMDSYGFALERFGRLSSIGPCRSTATLTPASVECAKPRADST